MYTKYHSLNAWDEVTPHPIKCPKCHRVSWIHWIDLHEEGKWMEIETSSEPHVCEDCGAEGKQNE